MNKTALRILIIFVCMLFATVNFVGCKSIKKRAPARDIHVNQAATKITSEVARSKGPTCYVYRTINDYNDRVPVIMNDEKTKIVSYPDPSDLFYRGKPSIPTPLDRGYLLDNRGITANVAFLTYTYKNYLALEHPPTLQQLMDSILEKNPLVELWQCGSRSRYKELEPELNALIHSGFPNCERLVPTFAERLQ